MKAVTVTAFGTPPVLREDVPEPTTGAWQVLVRVQASSVNWLDADIAYGALKDMPPHELPITLGRDFAWIVEAVGEGISGMEVGDEIFGAVPMAETVRDGAWAELVVTGGHTLTRKPVPVDTATAGAAALTASAALMTVDALDLAPGDTVLAGGRPAGSPYHSPGRPERPSCRDGPRTRSTCAPWARATYSRVEVTSLPPYAGNTPAGWTRSSTP
ncbi:alcohol dehydrogenase catalytic domain-containing protein [Streptomyces sp. DG2A-72]|uniref:alcohol dehydrogenase catalytic domain-containing protein n=1 Tax=Streptomyces sp. DG2A-72 TaxID=3051386 RepID=UPI00265C2E34|nr:alcohol dehydrogenase catalytic domain-containing protein [Streptomyces sp. DG2A-72]MDO0933728.1 alcohol dehydrogenase catalytic domain-containing protein [Streptomyces sp. DG2A-72]